MRPRCDYLLFSILIASLTLRVSVAGVIHTDVADIQVKGERTIYANNSFDVRGHSYTVDLNGDSIDEVIFRHGYVLMPGGMSSITRGIISHSQSAIDDIRRSLIAIREIAIDSATSGVNDGDDLAANQARLDNELDRIGRIANSTVFGKRPILDGSFGIQGISDSPGFAFLHGTQQTQPGSYLIEITNAGRRATLDATDQQTNTLAAAEILTINGVNISLEVGLTQTQVINRINDFTAETDVIADNGGTNGATRLYSEIFGSTATVSAISNVNPASGNSTEFANSTSTNTGVDVVAKIDGAPLAANGNVLFSNTGPSKGMSVAVELDPTDRTRTIAETGLMTVTDESLEFPFGPDRSQMLRITLPNMAPSSLGTGVSSNVFATLADIRIQTVTLANEALGVIDFAIDETGALIRSLDLLRLDGDYLTGSTHVIGLNGALVDSDNTYVTNLGRDEFIDRRLGFDSGALIDGSSLGISAWHDVPGYLGVEFLIDDRLHYGWIAVDVDSDAAVTILDYAYEDRPNLPIRAGAVPEPAGVGLIAWGWLGLLALRRHLTGVNEICR